MRIALLRNIQPATQDPDSPTDTFEEYDSPSTLQAISESLEELGLAVTQVEAGKHQVAELAAGSYDFVFNIAEGSGGRCREAISAAVCELLALPYTGSDPLTLGLTLDKYLARRVVRPEVPVARACLNDETGELRYPVIVKPNAEGSSKGIHDNAICDSQSEARRRREWLQATYRCSVLTEEFLPGAEVTAAVCGNGANTRVLALMEIAAADSVEPFVYSLDVKRNWKQRVSYHVPPRLPESTCRQIADHALTAYRLLGCRDIARLDFRLDQNGVPHFLECNPLPGLDPESSDLVIATRAILPYRKLVQGILLSAAERYGMHME